jgi:uncharacterized protein YgbK (DUF1537 family)
LIAGELKKETVYSVYPDQFKKLCRSGKQLTLTQEIGGNLKRAVDESGREIVVISRSDSTLRGHFPAEVDADCQGRWTMTRCRTIVLVPAFIEGGRIYH